MEPLWDICPGEEVPHAVCGANPVLIALKAGYNGRLSARRQSAAVLVFPSRPVSPEKQLFVQPEFRIAVQEYCPPSLNTYRAAERAALIYIIA